MRIGIQGPASPVKKCFVSLTQYDTWWELATWPGHHIPMSVAKPAAGDQQQEDAWVAVIEPALLALANPQRLGATAGFNVISRAHS